MFVDYKTGKKAFFKRLAKTPPITTANNYGKAADAIPMDCGMALIQTTVTATNC